MAMDLEDIITEQDITFLCLSESDFTQYEDTNEGREKYQDKVEKIILYIQDCISYLQTTFKTKNPDFNYHTFEENYNNNQNIELQNIVELTTDFTIAKRDASRAHHITPNTLSANYVFRLMSNYHEYIQFF